MDEKNTSQTSGGPQAQGSTFSSNKVIAPSAGFLEEINTRAAQDSQQYQERLQNNDSNTSAMTDISDASGQPIGAPAYSKAAPRVDTDSVYPTASPFSNVEYAQATSGRHTNYKEEKLGVFSSIPTGIIVIAVLTVIGAILQLFSVDGTTASQNSNAQLFGAFISIGLAVGLFFLKNIIRIFFLIIATLSVGSGIVGFIGTADIQQQYDSRKDIVAVEIQSLEGEKHLSKQEEFTLDRLRSENVYYEQLSGAKFAQAYLLWMISIGYNIFVIVYLLRPSIKDRFSA